MSNKGTRDRHRNRPLENCPLTTKVPSKIIAPTQANSPQRVLRMNWGKLSIVYEYYNMRGLQLRCKKWFTSICLLQILTKPCRAPLIRQHLWLKSSWFPYARTPKKEKINKQNKNWFAKKIQKYYIENNNNTLIRVWYLQDVSAEHTYLPKKNGIFPVKIIRN